MIIIDFGQSSSSLRSSLLPHGQQKLAPVELSATSFA